MNLVLIFFLVHSIKGDKHQLLLPEYPEAIAIHPPGEHINNSPAPIPALHPQPHNFYTGPPPEPMQPGFTEPTPDRDIKKVLKGILLMKMGMHLRGEYSQFDEQCTSQLHNIDKVVECAYTLGYKPLRCKGTTKEEMTRFLNPPSQDELYCYEIEITLRMWCPTFRLPCNLLELYKSAPTTLTKEPSEISERFANSEVKCNDGEFLTHLGCQSCSEETSLGSCFIPDIDCQVNNGIGYRGSVSKTESGIQCQPWALDHPHTHTRKPDEYKYSGLESNFCRNPDGEVAVWCYTMDSNVRFDLCNVPVCPKKYDYYCQLNIMDKGKVISNTYRGRTAQTKSGKDCLNWLQQVDSNLGLFSSENRAATLAVGVGDHNLCRDLYNKGAVWCYTSTSPLMWEDCDVSWCDKETSTETCQNGEDRGASYRGTINTTNGAITCQNWETYGPHDHPKLSPQEKADKGVGNHNYCRNTDGESRVWCYTTESNTRWDFCPVPVCNRPIDWVDPTTIPDNRLVYY